jgi:hypothetical protein
MELLASLEQYAASRGVEADLQDLRALMQLQAASSSARGYTGQLFDYVAEDEVIVDGHGTKSILLPQLPVHGVSEVATLASDGTETLLDDPEDWTLGDHGILYRRRSWRAGVKNIRLIYDHGYILPGQQEVSGVEALPAEISLVVMQRATRGLVTSRSEGQVVKERQIDDYREVFETGGAELREGWTDLELEILDRYRPVQGL